MNNTPAILAALREAITAAPMAELPSIIGAVEAVKTEAMVRIMTAQAPAPVAEPEGDGLLVDATEAARMLGVKSSWVRDHQRDPALGRVDLPGRKLRFSAKRIAQIVKRRSYAGGERASDAR